MKIFQKFGVGLVFILAFAVLAIAQTEKKQSATPIKIAFVYAVEFEEEKTGIKELSEITKTIKDELKPQTEELALLDKKYRDLIMEIGKISNDYRFSGSAETKKLLDDKIKEYESLNIEIENERKELESQYEKRKLEVAGETIKKIDDVMKQFAKEKGYEMILDISIYRNSCFFLAPGSDANVTDEFIKYYNSLAAKQQ